MKQSTAHEEKREQSGIAGGLTEEQERKIEKWAAYELLWMWCGLTKYE